MEALTAGFVAQTIVQMLQSQGRQERRKGVSPDFSDSLAQTVQAHVWLNVTNLGISEIKDVSKLGSLVASLLREGGEWTQLATGLAKLVGFFLLDLGYLGTGGRTVIMTLTHLTIRQCTICGADKYTPRM